MTKNQIIATLTIVLGLSGATIFADSLWLDTALCTITDPKTNLTCSEILENPSQDVYFIVDDSDYNDAIWDLAQQNPETVRWNLDNTKFIVKYNAIEVPRNQVGITKALNNPMNVSEIRPIVNGEGWVDANTIGKVIEETRFAEDNVTIQENE